MPPIVIVTDSASDIDPALRESLGIVSVPLKVNFGDETYLDGVTLNSGDFYRKLKESGVAPTTSQPSPNDFAEAYKSIVARHGKDVQIIAIILSGALSGTYQSALIGKSLLDEEIDITVIDSKGASFMQGLMVVQAARAVRAGQSKEQVLDLIGRMIDEIQVYFMVDTLDYLQRGGRIGKASALIGSLLNIKPILSLDESGSIYPFEKVRGTKKALARILEELKAYAQDEPVIAVIAHADALDEARDLLARVQVEFRVAESFLVELGPVIGTHSGPGLLGVIMTKTLG